MIRSVAEAIAAWEDGRVQVAHWRKYAPTTPSSGGWTDLAPASGNPGGQYYASTPMIGVPLRRSTHVGSIDHGGNVAPLKKYLARAKVFGSAASACSFILCDHLLYYPFIDESDDEPQFLETPEPLPRYADGRGVRIMVVKQQPHTNYSYFTVTYVNQDGAERTVQARLGAATSPQVATSGTGYYNFGPFLPLAPGDTGVRSIVNVDFGAADTGLSAFVLTRPLASFSTGSLNGCATEKCMLTQGGGVMPIVEDDAFLALVAHTTANIATAQILGDLTFLWG